MIAGVLQASGSDEPISAGGMAEGSGVFGAIGTFNGFPLALVSTERLRIDRRLLRPGWGERRKKHGREPSGLCISLRKMFRSGREKSNP